MESLIVVLVGILVSVGTYLILSRHMIRVIVGTAILSHAVHLLILAMGGLKKGLSHYLVNLKASLQMPCLKP